MFNNFEKLKLGGELKAQCSLLSAIKRSRRSRGASGVHDLLGLGAGGRRSCPQCCSHTCSSSLQSWWPSPPEACTSWWSPEGWLMDETFISIRGDALPGPLCSAETRNPITGSGVSQGMLTITARPLTLDMKIPSSQGAFTLNKCFVLNMCLNPSGLVLGWDLEMCWKVFGSVGFSLAGEEMLKAALLQPHWSFEMC